MQLRTIHILTPSSSQTPNSFVLESKAKPDDYIVDFRQFPFSVYRVHFNQTLDITADFLPQTDYWMIAREWLIRLTDQTGLQDTLAIEGYGFWWSLRSLSFAPVLTDIGNAFIWIDLLAEIQKRQSFQSVIIYSQYEPLIHIAKQIFQETPIQLKSKKDHHANQNGRLFPKVGLLTVRILLGIIYFLYATIRRPEILFFSTSNLVRNATVTSKQQLRDIYLDDVSEILKVRGWRVGFTETYRQNASWQTLVARRFFFPNDVLMVLSQPRLQKLGRYRYVVHQWRQKWADIKPDLSTYLKYRGYDIAPLVLPLIEQMFVHYAPYFEIMTSMWRHILKVWQPRLLYVNAYYGLPATSAIVAAKILNIPTIEQQHGAIGKNSAAYLVPRCLKTTTDFPLCDIFLVWGEHFKRLMVEKGVYAPENVVVSGFPRIDSLLAELPPKAETVTRLGILPDRPVVLYTSNMNAHGFLSDILDSIQNLPPDTDIHWIIKLHPREKTRPVWEMEIKRRQLRTVSIVESEFDFYALLAACDLHVSFVSTTLIEAAVLGKINLGLEMEHFIDPVGFTEAKAFLPVLPEGLGSTVYDILRDRQKRERLLQEQRKFANEWCLHDGQAVQRIADFIDLFINESQRKN